MRSASGLWASRNSMPAAMSTGSSGRAITPPPARLRASTASPATLSTTGREQAHASNLFARLQEPRCLNQALHALRQAVYPGVHGYELILHAQLRPHAGPALRVEAE